MSDWSEFQSFQSSVYHWSVTTQTKYERGWDTTHHTQDIFTRETHRQAVRRQDEAGCVAQQRDTEAHTHARWVMGSQTQQRVTQPKGCSLTLIVCREESALGFITPVVSGERKPTAASLGLLANISSSCRHSSRRACDRPPLTQHLSHVPFFFALSLSSCLAVSLTAVVWFLTCPSQTSCDLLLCTWMRVLTWHTKWKQISMWVSRLGVFDHRCNQTLSSEWWMSSVQGLTFNKFIFLVKKKKKKDSLLPKGCRNKQFWIQQRI